MSYFDYFDINNVRNGIYVVIPNSYKKKLITDFINANREDVVEFTKYNFPPIFYKIIMKDNNNKELYKILRNYNYDIMYNLENIKNNMNYEEYSLLYKSDYQPPIRDRNREYKIAITCEEIDEYLTKKFKDFLDWQCSRKTINNIDFYSIRINKNKVCIFEKELHNFYNRYKLNYYKLFPEQFPIKKYNITIYDNLFGNKLKDLFIKEHKAGNCGKYNIIETLPSVLEVNINTDEYDRIIRDIAGIIIKYPNKNK